MQLCPRCPVGARLCAAAVRTSAVGCGAPCSTSSWISRRAVWSAERYDVPTATLLCCLQPPRNVLSLLLHWKQMTSSEESCFKIYVVLFWNCKQTAYVTFISCVVKRWNWTLMYYQPKTGRWHCCWCSLNLTQHVSFFGLCVQAAFILQNLLVMPMPANAEEAKDSHWQVSSSASQLKCFYGPWTVFSLSLSLSFSFLFVSIPSPFLPHIPQLSPLSSRSALQGSGHGCS